MATPFEDIYNRALFRFADFKFLELDLENRDAVLEKYLMSAKTDFQRICKVDLNDCDLEGKQFNVDLGDDEIEILALGIAFYWVSYKALDSQLLKNSLSSRDYYYYSPAQLLKEVHSFRTSIKREFRSRMREYSYKDNEIESLKAGGGQ